MPAFPLCEEEEKNKTYVILFSTSECYESSISLSVQYVLQQKPVLLFCKTSCVLYVKEILNN
jgi:hypothetical protein